MIMIEISVVDNVCGIGWLVSTIFMMCLYVADSNFTFRPVKKYSVLGNNIASYNLICTI